MNKEQNGVSMKLYQLDELKRGIFKSRPNRYIAQVMIDGHLETVHVHDPGRLKELLWEDNEVIVRYAAHPKRKTDWDMIAAKKEDEFVLIHSGIHRYLAENLLRDDTIEPFGHLNQLKAEVKAKHSRFDFYAIDDQETPIWIEVKGCSLSVNGLALFPDAPTVRGTRHIEELISLKREGARAGLIILVLSQSQLFAPKKDTDPKFHETFYRALEEGVEIHPLRIDFDAEKGRFEYVGEIPIKNPSGLMD